MTEGVLSPETGIRAGSLWTTSPGRRSPWLMPLLLTLYFGIVILLFFYWVNPSLIGENNRHIVADSPRYIYFADALRKGDLNPYVIGALYSFPNTSWGPVLLALLLPDNFSVMLMNLGIFALSLWLCGHAVEIDPVLFLGLLLLNPTTTINLLAANKELLDLLTLSLFLCHLRSRNRLLLALALVISLVSRYETCVTMSIFLFLRSRWNPWRRRRLLSLAGYCIVLDIAIAALLASPTQAYRLAEAQGTSAYSGGTLLLLNGLEQHFLFVIALLPKILENLFGELFNVPHWFLFSMEDPANTFLVFGNNLANLVIISLMFAKRQLSLRSSLVYYAALIAITMSISVVVQPRYFYAMYALLCLEAARRFHRMQPEILSRSANAAA